eukprot:scaffold47808_cov70-Phaeocystis_antarctica.AAC.1
MHPGLQVCGDKLWERLPRKLVKTATFARHISTETSNNKMRACYSSPPGNKFCIVPRSRYPFWGT